MEEGEAMSSRAADDGYEEEEKKKNKNFLDFIIAYIKSSKEAKKPRLDSMT